MWTIIKLIKNEHGVELPVLLLDSNHEILEFDTEEEAEKMRSLFQSNSDSNYKYTLRKIG